jgi:hypothetical protein
MDFKLIGIFRLSYIKITIILFYQCDPAIIYSLYSLDQFSYMLLKLLVIKNLWLNGRFDYF